MDVTKVNKNTFKIVLSDEQLEILRRDVEKDRQDGFPFVDLSFSLATAIISGIDLMRRVQENH